MSDADKEERANEGHATTPIRTIKKRIIPLEFSDPVTEPLFINYVHGIFVGGSAYLDVGVITLESFDPSENASGVGDFAVLTRLVMSKETLMLMRDQIETLLEHGDIQHGTSNSPQD